MRRQRLLSGALLAALIVSTLPMASRHEAMAPGVAAAQKNNSAAINVTTTVYDFDAGSQLLMRSDDPTGAGQSTYITVKGSKGAGNLVTSQITADGLWQLSLTDQSGRRVWITPNQPVDGSQPAAPPAGYYAIQKAYSACRDQNGNIVPYPSLVNGSGNCSLGVNFSYGGVLYKLLVRPDSLDSTLCPSGGCPATGLAKVTCNAVGNNKCVNWTVAPNADAPLAGVANLYSYTGPRGTPWVYIGQYHNYFRINASYP